MIIIIKSDRINILDFGGVVQIMTCGLNENFMADLKDGRLKSLLDFVHKDDTLSLEIRQNFIELYYRGQKLCRVISEDDDYKIINLSQNDQNIEKYCDEWSKDIPLMKQNVDFYLHDNPNLEMEYGQYLIRENNRDSQACGTDYYMAVMDYNNHGENKINLIGIKWLATESSRTKGDRITIAFIEMKYGDKNQNEDSILQKHTEGLSSFIQNKKNLFSLYGDIETIFNQKLELALINGVDKKIVINRNIKPEFILVVSSHRGENHELISEIRKVTTSFDYSNLVQNINMKVAKTNYAGYGLYEEQILNIQEFVNEYQDMWGTHIDY